MKFTFPPGATPLDADEAQDLLVSSVATAADLNELEQANILEASQWALGARKKRPLSEEFVRRLHKRMLGDVWRWAGKYRQSNKNLGVDWPQVPVEVRKLCQDAAYWVQHRTFEWDELGARFHHRLVSIHPFPNGNGRHARLITDVLLKSADQPLFSWGANADLARAGDTRSRYIEALRAADTRNFKLLVAFVRT